MSDTPDLTIRATAGRRPVVVVNVVGLTPALLAHAPRLQAIAAQGFSAPMDGILPAVTCSAQSTMLTGLDPTDHGIVAVSRPAPPPPRHLDRGDRTAARRSHCHPGR